MYCFQNSHQCDWAYYADENLTSCDTEILRGLFCTKTIVWTWGWGKVPSHCSLSACSQYLWMLPNTTAQLWSLTAHSEVLPFLSIVAKNRFLVLQISNQGDKISHEISQFAESPKYSAYVGCIVQEYNSKWNTAQRLPYLWSCSLVLCLTCSGLTCTLEVRTW